MYCLDDYPYSRKQSPSSSGDDEMTNVACLRSKTASVGWQTPKEWLTSSHAQERKEKELSRMFSSAKIACLLPTIRPSTRAHVGRCPPAAVQAWTLEPRHGAGSAAAL